MKTMLAVAAALVAICGCETKAPAEGRETFEKIQKAEREKDAAAFWELLSKKSREAVGDREKLKAELETPKYAAAKYVEEKADGDRVTVTVEIDGKKSDLVLVKEDGALRLQR